MDYNKLTSYSKSAEDKLCCLLSCIQTATVIQFEPIQFKPGLVFCGPNSQKLHEALDVTSNGIWREASQCGHANGF